MEHRRIERWPSCAIASVLALLGTNCSTVPPSAAKVVAEAPAAEVDPVPDPDLSFELTRLRCDHHTEVFSEVERAPAPSPPSALFERVHYPAPLGDNVAYVTPVRGEERGPAIVWIAGGFDWGIGSEVWSSPPRSNDQTAGVFREAGVVLMRPSLRGSNENPGRNECFLGEVDDVIAAGRYLASRPDVDPERVYLGGHSTGGTLVLLAAASTDRFRAVVAFGPVADPREYGDGGCMSPTQEGAEARLRNPTEFLDQIRTPTLVIEGLMGGNAMSFSALEAARGNAPVQLLIVPGTDHFGVLAPVSELLAQAIIDDRDFGEPDVVSLSEATGAVGSGVEVTPAAHRMVRAARLPARSLRAYTEQMDADCREQSIGAEECRVAKSFLNESVLEALLAEAVSRSASPTAIAEATRFYESEAGMAWLRFSFDPDSSPLTSDQLRQLRNYRTRNAELEGPRGAEIFGEAVDAYMDQLFE